MRLVSIIYVSDMDRSVDFYTGLGAELGATGRNPYWTELTMGDTPFALHITEPFTGPDSGRMGISLIADRPLEEVAAELRTVGIEPTRGIADESFGRSMVIRDPDGIAIQINEHDEHLHPS